MNTNRKQPLSGSKVVLTELPPGLVDGSILVDQRAVRAIVGQPVVLSGYDDFGSAELQFTDSRGHIHFIYVNPSYIRPVE
jgi:hypothetical protein